MYSVALQESVQGRIIPIETPQRTADLWQEGLEDTPQLLSPAPFTSRTSINYL
jgi:hypothetical protein